MTLMRLKPRVLLVGDSLADLLEMSRVLDRLGCQVTAVGDGSEAVQALGTEDFDGIVSELHLQQVDGGDLYAYVAARLPQLAARFVVVTDASAGGDPAARRLKALGCRELLKPIRMDEVRQIVSCLFDRSPSRSDHLSRRGPS